MVFVDGSNLLVELSKELAIPFRAEHLPSPAIAIAKKLIQRAITLGPRPFDLVRLYWFGSCAGDDNKIFEASQRLRSFEFEPLLFKSKNGKEKGVDIALATVMLANAFSQNFDFGLLVSGDEDYVTLVNETKRHGPAIHGAFFESGLSPILRLALDGVFTLDVANAGALVEELRPQF